MWVQGDRLGFESMEKPSKGLGGGEPIVGPDPGTLATDPDYQNGYRAIFKRYSQHPLSLDFYINKKFNLFNNRGGDT